MSEAGGAPVALVTGASSGIGAATARALAGAGYAVALAARRAEALDGVAATIRARGGQALALPADMLVAAQVAALAQTVEARLGPVAVLVNNAGVNAAHRAWQPADEVVEGIVGTNLLAPMLMVRAVAPGMVTRRRGHIINIGSVAAHVTMPGGAIYSASKAGLRAWNATLRRELAREGVRVSLVSPGYIRTEMTQGVRAPMAPPELIAQTVLRLLRRPQREVVVPGYYRAAIWLELFAPWLVDRVAALGRRRWM